LAGLWYKLMANHQDATSQPMQYYTVNADGAGVFAAPPGALFALALWLLGRGSRLLTRRSD
jgi:hypothetical protein